MSPKPQRQRCPYGHYGVECPHLGLVCLLFVGLCPRSRTVQSTQNRQAAERDDGQRQNRDQQRLVDHKIESLRHGAERGEKQQPSTAEGGLPDAEPRPGPEADVGDGMDDGQVSLHAGEDVNGNLSVRRDREEEHAEHHQHRAAEQDAAAIQGAARVADHLYGNHVVDESVRVTRGRALRPPTPEAQAEDEGVEREEEEEVGDGEAGESVKGAAVLKTHGHVFTEERGWGGEKGGVGGRRGHVCLRREGRRG